MSSSADQITAAASAVTDYALAAPASVKAQLDAFIAETQTEIDAITSAIASLQSSLKIHQVALANARGLELGYVPPAPAPLPTEHYPEG